MKALALLVFASSLSFAQYTGPKTVYILPMSGGLDQYIAQQLTKDHLMQVVADPKAAQVFMTDSLGPGFEQRLKTLLPTDTSSKSAGDDSPHTFRTSRSHGTIFIVDAKSLHVLWSDHHKPPASTSDRSLSLAAAEITRELSGPKNSGN